MAKKKDKEKEEKFVNPIDPDKVAENPGLLPYAHHVGSALIKPIDKGKVKGLAVEAMYDQTERQLDQIRQQVELLASQAQEIHDRITVSEKIYLADMNIKPLMNKIYHLYTRKTEEKHILSLIAPDEWGSNCPYDFVSSVRLLSDHTWEIVKQA